MRILVTNDDGIQALGLSTLVKTLAKKHDVYVVAPYRQQSAKSHAITVNQPLMVHRLNLYPEAKMSIAVEGTPVDCVKIAVERLMDLPPDVVLSGINDGPNLGNDVLYSGTVAAAVEGSFYNIPSIALSLCGRREKGYGFGADYILNHLEQMLEIDLPLHTALNVNFPVLPAEEIKGTKVTILGLRLYDNTFEHRLTPHGDEYYWLAGEPKDLDQPDESDIHAVADGYVSVTPVRFDFNNHDALRAVKAGFEG